MLIASSTLCIFVRVFVRVRYISFGLDDCFCVIGWVLTVLECLVCIISKFDAPGRRLNPNHTFLRLTFNTTIVTNYGYGKHIDTIHDANTIQMFLKLDFVTELSYVLALGCIKISFCLFYLKIFPGKVFRILCWCVLVVLAGETLADFFVVVFQCSPVYKAWDAAGVVDGKCLQLLSFFYIAFGIRLGTDFALLALPIPQLLKLKIAKGKRVGLIVMFGLGGLVMVTSIIRVTYLSNFSIDHTWSLVDPLNWSSTELGVGVINACVPSFKALVTFRYPKLRSMLGLSSDRSHGARYEMYGSASRRATHPDDPGSWRRSHGGTAHAKSGTTRTRTDVETSWSGSEERIIPQSRDGIHVTTDVRVDSTEHQELAKPHWPLGR
ncbi:uncharacterized protein N7482_009262 [Penicillium canariense]|uniref:Rhodopsin domain-containing protein n=1 Tax=Penicillium canariense TaxID=189055 RepID=A0A9W9LFK0_9EURO|nr:uncharacterized protein N7482_009262 [Penicillium canariense]KAJ5152784.1 hypothetical protein N7482_009262 [Penicillium canariense]